MTATLLYETDAWHSANSMDLKGVFTDEEKLNEAVRLMIHNRIDDNFDPSYYDNEDLKEDYEGCRADFEQNMFEQFEENGQTQENVNVYTVEYELDDFDEDI